MDVLNADVVVIGAGSAGLAAYDTAARFTDSIYIVDAVPHGTKCAIDGCMPSKLLIAASDAAATLRRASVLGVRADVEIDGTAVFERIRKERDRFVASVLESMPRERLLEGRARFLDDRTIELADGRRVRAKSFVVATGNETVVPEPLKAVLDRVLTHRTVFDLERPPRSLAVIGAGTIGLELGQALARLGTRARIIEMKPELELIRDPAIRCVMTDLLAGELALCLGAELVRAARTSEGVGLEYASADGRHTWHAEYVLAAAGTRPRVAELDLETAGVTVRDGKPCFDRQTLRCSDTRVFLAGDVTGERPVLHEAVAEGRHAGNNAVRRDPLAFVRQPRLQIVFTRPEIAQVGKTIDELDANDTATGEVDFSDQGRARVENVASGRLRVYADRTSSVLVGAELAAPRGEHLAHLLAWAVARRMRLDELLDLPFYHPCFEEGVRTALRSAQRQCRLAGPSHSPLDCGVGS